MATQQLFTSPSFILLSAVALDASTVAATFSYPVIVGSGVYSLLSAHGEVRTVQSGVGANSHQVYLHTNLPLTQDFWTLTYSGQLEDPLLTVVTPGAFLFWAGVGVIPVGVPEPPFSGDELTAEQFLRREIPSKSMKGDVWSCLIAGLATGEQIAWDNAPSVERQMFLSTASGVWLDRRAAGIGLERPLNVGMPDEAFRQYAVQISSHQQTILAILETLRIFYDVDAVQAHVSSSNEAFTLIDGQTLTITLDSVQTIVVTFNVADFQNIALATSIEVASVLNREFLLQGAKAEARVSSDPNTNLTLFTIYSSTMGGRGSIQIASSAAQVALGLPTSLERLLGQSRAAYVLTRGKNQVEVVLPATTDVVSRTAQNAAYISGESGSYGEGVYGEGLYGKYPDTLSSGVGPYLFEGINEGLTITETATTLTGSPLLVDQEYRLLTVADASNFPDNEGWVVFGYGFNYQAGPVHYLGRAGPNAILIDPNFTFTQEVPVGAYVNLLVDNKPNTSQPGETGDFWLTDSPAGRVAASSTIDAISAAGYVLTKTISFPGDSGLAYAGYPTHGTRALSSIVQCFAGSDIDAELEAARSE